MMLGVKSFSCLDSRGKVEMMPFIESYQLPKVLGSKWEMYLLRDARCGLFLLKEECSVMLSYLGMQFLKPKS